MWSACQHKLGRRPSLQSRRTVIAAGPVRKKSGCGILELGGEKQSRNVFRALAFRPVQRPPYKRCRTTGGDTDHHIAFGLCHEFRAAAAPLPNHPRRLPRRCAMPSRRRNDRLHHLGIGFRRSVGHSLRVQDTSRPLVPAQCRNSRPPRWSAWTMVMDGRAITSLFFRKAGITRASSFSIVSMSRNTGRLSKFIVRGLRCSVQRQ